MYEQNQNANRLYSDQPEAYGMFASIRSDHKVLKLSVWTTRTPP